MSRASSPTNDYFSRLRTDILPLLPTDINRVLEVGCGTGATLRFLKASGRCRWTAGVEIEAAAAEVARTCVDLVLDGDIERLLLPIEPGSIDLILSLDVLEHLVDPWSTVKKLHPLLAAGGALVASIPNVRHVRVVLPLVVRGRWTYTDAGLLDRTHLRFFTRASVVELLECSGLRIDRLEALGLAPGSKSAVFNVLTGSLFRPFFEAQYLVRARNLSG